MRCRTLKDIVGEVLRLINDEKDMHPEIGAEFFFRGESKNHQSEYDDEILRSGFQSFLDREGLVDYERKLFEEAMRLNIASFEHDKTMVERIARMQHYQLPTRFADMSSNALLSTHFACNANPHRDGFIRVMKVAEHKMKSFTSDVIIAISHLPLVDAEHVNPNSEDGLGYLTYEIKNSRPGFIYEREWPEIGEALRREIQHVWAFKPVLNSQRIRKQGGLFLAFGCGDKKKSLKPSFSPEDYENSEAPSYGIKEIGYVRIAAESKFDIREDLRLFGMEAESVYPELSNVCDELKNRFCKMKEKSR